MLVEGKAVLDQTSVFSQGSEVIVTARPSDRKRAKGSSGDVVASVAVPKLLVFYDSQVVVVEKPSGISTVPYDRDERDTLDRRVMAQLARGQRRTKLFLVHRIDKETTGLLVFAATAHAQARLKTQFRFHTVERRYFALVRGHVRSQTISSRLVQDRGDGLRGSTINPKLGREAITHVRLIERFAQSSLVECRLETGRTHQIRIHLSEAGHPLLGERVYSRGYSGARIEAPRTMLHAATLGFDHPGEDGRRMTYESELPADFTRVIAQLRGAHSAGAG